MLSVFARGILPSVYHMSNLYPITRVVKEDEELRLSAVSRSRESLPLALLLLAFAVGMAGIQFARNGIALLRGSGSYVEMADQYLTDGAFVSAYRPPLYPLLLVTLKTCFGAGWESAAFVVHLVLAVGSGWFIFLLTRRLSGSFPAAVCALLLFFGHGILQLELITRRETALFLFLELGVFVLVTSARLNIARAMLVGGLAGLAHLTRPNGILLLTALLVPLAVHSGWFRQWRRALGLGIAALSVFLAATVPWHIRMYQLTDVWTVSSSTTSGLNMWKGNNPMTSSVIPWIDIDELEPWARARVGGGSLTSDKADRALAKAAGEWVKEHPIRAALLTVKKFFIFLNPMPVPWGTGQIQVLSDDRILIDDFRPRRGWMFFFLYMMFLYLGIWIARERLLAVLKTPAGVLFAGAVTPFCLLLVVIHTLSFPETRLRLPLDVVMIVLSGVGYGALQSEYRKSLVALARRR
jgi:hypothetical protein